MTSDTPSAPLPPADAGSAQRDRTEILRLLRRMVTESVALTLVHGERGEVAHARLVGLSDDERSLFLDGATDGAADAVDHLTRHPTLTCLVNLGHDRIHFTVEPKAGTFARRKVVRARVPDMVVKVQRREYFRLDITPDDGVTCTVPLAGPAAGSGGSAGSAGSGGREREVAVTVVDLSATGIAFTLPMAAAAGMRLGAELPRCAVTLGDDLGRVVHAVQIRSLRRVTAVGDDGEPVSLVRVGAEFTGMAQRDIGLVQRALGTLARRRRDAEREAEQRAALAARAGARAAG